MSLETKIEKLTEAVELLTKAILERDIVELASHIVEPTVEVTKETVKKIVESEKPKAEKPKAEKPAKENAKPVTAEEVQAVCMKLVREDSAKKKPIVELLAEYGAKTVGQVKADKLAELKSKLEML